jgi:hypothetical protein
MIGVQSTPYQLTSHMAVKNLVAMPDITTYSGTFTESLPWF